MGAACSSTTQPAKGERRPSARPSRSAFRTSAKPSDAASHPLWREHSTTLFDVENQEPLRKTETGRSEQRSLRWSETGSLTSSRAGRKHVESVSFDLAGRSKAPMLSVGLGVILMTAFIDVPIVTLATISAQHADEPALDADVGALSVWQKEQILRAFFAERTPRGAAADESGPLDEGAGTFEELAGSLALLKGEAPPRAAVSAAAARLARQELAAAKVVGDAFGAADQE
jgi:hypothetical protein